jgi:hypothetical protein
MSQLYLSDSVICYSPSYYRLQVVGLKATESRQRGVENGLPKGRGFRPNIDNSKGEFYECETMDYLPAFMHAD